MEYLGKLVNTHGLRGEVKIISDFKYKDIVFKEGNVIYIEDTQYSIKSYRTHKNFDMVKLEGITKIEQAEVFKGSSVYINKNDYKFPGVLDSDLIGLSVYDKTKYKGKIVGIEKSTLYTLLVVDGVKRHLIPNIEKFIKDIDLDNKKIYINYIKGLDNEN